MFYKNDSIYRATSILTVKNSMGHRHKIEEVYQNTMRMDIEEKSNLISTFLNYPGILLLMLLRGLRSSLYCKWIVCQTQFSFHVQKAIFKLKKKINQKIEKKNGRTICSIIEAKWKHATDCSFHRPQILFYSNFVLCFVSPLSFRRPLSHFGQLD